MRDSASDLAQNEQQEQIVRAGICLKSSCCTGVVTLMIISVDMLRFPGLPRSGWGEQGGPPADNEQRSSSRSAVNSPHHTIAPVLIRRQHRLLTGVLCVIAVMLPDLPPLRCTIQFKPDTAATRIEKIDILIIETKIIPSNRKKRYKM